MNSENMEESDEDVRDDSPGEATRKKKDIEIEDEDEDDGEVEDEGEGAGGAREDDDGDGSDSDIIIRKKKKVDNESDDGDGKGDETKEGEDEVENDGEDSDAEIIIRKKKVNKDEDEDDGEDSEDSEDSEDEVKRGADGDEDAEEGAAEGPVDDEEEEDSDREPKSQPIYDFDIMMAKKKEENSRKRKRRNYDIINDNDDFIADIINQMKDAVEVDSEANKKKMAATKKLKLLPFVMSQLRKVDLRDAFLDSDVLSVITEWLAPLPDRSLPHLNIRESLLKTLIDFNLHDVDRIKSSGIGKAVMYLYKHPKETKENKQRAKELISCWSRPIFNLDTSFDAISREEREQRDLDLMSKQRRASKTDSDGEGAGTSSKSKKSKDEAAQKPGDKGWIPRARVPAPSMKDYVIRPRSKVDGDIGRNSKRPTNLLDKYMKTQLDRKRASRQQRAINMKIDRV